MGNEGALQIRMVNAGHKAARVTANAEVVDRDAFAESNGAVQSSAAIEPTWLVQQQVNEDLRIGPLFPQHHGRTGSREAPAEHGSPGSRFCKPPGMLFRVQLHN
eukprot:1161127-Pelagomonas_calceolata.AAC.2